MTNALTDAAIVQSTIAGLESHIFKLEEANKIYLQIIKERDARIVELEGVTEEYAPLLLAQKEHKQ